VEKPLTACEICGRREALYVCRECGRKVCGECLDLNSWLCPECLSRVEREAGEARLPELSLLVPLGFLLIFAGIILLVFSAFASAPASGGGFFFIFPFFFGFGFGKEAHPLLFTASTAVFLLFLAFFIYLLVKAWRIG